MNFFNIFQSVRLNWQSGLTVALVSLPLSIALSVGSGAGVIPGVITGVWACLIASIFGGSKYNIIGVAGALTSVLSGVAALEVLKVNGLSGIAFFPLLAILTGLIILVVYALRLERYLVYIPSSVMHGFAAGVAILIAVSQINDALGLTVEKRSEFIEKFEGTATHISQTHLPSFAIFLAALATLLIFKFFIKKVPGVIPVSIVGVGFGFAINKTTWFPFFLDVTNLQQSLEKLGITNLDPQLFLPFNTQTWHAFFTSSTIATQLITLSFIIALIAILETLITAKLADKITKQTTNNRQEVLALGLANLGSGLTGGLPASGVFIRTGLNVKSGATSKASGILTAIFTAVLAIFLLPYFKYLPMPILAAILFNTAIGLLEIHHFVHYFHHDKKSLIVALSVMLLTVTLDASVGILIGTSLALLFFVDKLSKGEFEVRFNRNNKIVEAKHGSLFQCIKDADVVVYSIEGIMVYLDAPAHIENLQKIAATSSIHSIVLRLRDLFYVDLDGMDMLQEGIILLQAAGKNVILTEPTEEIMKEILKNEVILNLQKQGKIVAKTADALKILGFKPEDIGAREGKTAIAC